MGCEVLQTLDGGANELQRGVPGHDPKLLRCFKRRGCRRGGGDDGAEAPDRAHGTILLLNMASLPSPSCDFTMDLGLKCLNSSISAHLQYASRPSSRDAAPVPPSISASSLGTAGTGWKGLQIEPPGEARGKKDTRSHLLKPLGGSRELRRVINLTSLKLSTTPGAWHGNLSTWAVHELTVPRQQETDRHRQRHT